MLTTTTSRGGEKPVSSYASLASGPPPSYARAGSNDDRPPSPPRSNGPSFFRGGGRGGRYDSDRGRGGRPFRGGGGGRDRSDGRLDRYPEHASPDRFASDRNNQSGYEDGEILHNDRLPTQRSSSNTGHRRMEERPSFEGRGGRIGDTEGRGSGRFIPRGGGRDGGRGGRGRGGRYFERGGRGGRSDYRGGRGRGGDGREPFNSGKEWTPAGTRSTQDVPQRFLDNTPRSDDRFHGGDANIRKEPMYPRGDDRINPPERSFASMAREPINRGRYSSLANEPDIPPTRMEPRQDDRFAKRRREDQGFYSNEYDEKRTRNNEFMPRNRSDDIRPFPSGGPQRHSSISSGPSNSDLRPPHHTRPSNDMRNMDQDHRGTGQGPDGPFIGDSFGGGPQMDDRRSRSGIEPRMGGTNHRDDIRGPIPPRDDQRGVFPPRDDLRGAPAHRDDLRGTSLQRGRIPPHREDLRSAPERFRDDGNNGPPSQRHFPRNDFQNNPGFRDPRPPIDSRSRLANEDSIGSRPFDTRDESRPVDGLYNDTSPHPSRTSAISHDGPNRTSDDMTIDRSRDFQGNAEFMGFRRGSDMGVRKDDYRPMESQMPQAPGSRNIPPVQQRSSQPFNLQTQPDSRTAWHASQSRSPIQSPGSGRRTPVPPGSDQVPPFDDGPVDMPLSYSENRPDGRNFVDSFPDRGRGRGRGRGFRGRGRGSSDFGRFGGRGPNEYFKSPSRDGAFTQQPSYRSLDDRWTRPEDGDEGKDGSWQSQSSTAPNDRAITNLQKPTPTNLNEFRDSSRQQNAKDSTGEMSAPTVLGKQEQEQGPRPLTPPPIGKPSGVMQALVRLVDLEAQMEYAYAKHMLLVKRQKELQLQAKVLADLPVGFEAFKEELEALDSTKAAN